MSSLCSPTCLATESPATLAKNWGLTNPLLHLDVFGGTHTYGMRPWLRLAHSVALRNLEKCYPSSALFQGKELVNRTRSGLLLPLTISDVLAESTTCTTIHSNSDLESFVNSFSFFTPWQSRAWVMEARRESLNCFWT